MSTENDPSIAALFASWNDWGKTPGIDQIERSLLQLKEDSNGANATRRSLIRGEAIERLKAANVPHAEQAVNATLGGQTIQFPTVEPLDNVDGEGLMDLIADTIRQYVALPEHAIVAIALWIAHSYCMSVLTISPLLRISSPVMRCGKTTLVMVIGAMAHRTCPTSGITPAALFRVLDEYKPTILIDEVDTLFGRGNKNEDLRAMLNAGHTRQTAKIIKTVPVDGGFEPREFSVWAAKVVAGIGRLPNTIEDRSVPIVLRRKAPGDRVTRLRQDRIGDDVQYLRNGLAGWSRDHLAALKDADPPIPDALNDRARDNWRPLIAIADLVGGTWPERARNAAVVLSGQESVEDIVAVMLSDLHALFEDGGKSFISTENILAALTVRDDRPWPEWKDGKPMTPVQLARLLRPFDVRPKEQREGNKVVRGYFRSDCRDAFGRYLA